MANSSADTLDDLYDQLDERKQEEDLKKPSSSLLLDVDANDIKEREPEYHDPEKHWVRRDGWLKIVKKILASKQRITKNAQAKLKYLTLPGYYRLDISMFMGEDLIEVLSYSGDGTPREINVVGFETDPTKYGRMKVQTPRLKLLGASSIEAALVDPENEYFHELKDQFPFDVINMDLTTSLTPRHEGPYSKTMKAIDTIFSLQSGYGSEWAFFLTFRNVPSDWEETALTQLSANMQSNLDTKPTVFEQFYKTYNKSSVEELWAANQQLSISQTLVKWLVDRAHAFGFRSDLKKVYRYTRYKKGIEPYDIYKHLLVFSIGQSSEGKIPTKGVNEQAWMTEDLVKSVLRHKPIDVEEKLLQLQKKKDILGLLEQEVKKLVASYRRE